MRAALARQIQVTGVQALPCVCGVALLFGAVVVTRALELLGPDDDTVLKAVVWGGIRWLGPLVTATTSASTSATEPAAAAEQANALRLLGRARSQLKLHDEAGQSLAQALAIDQRLGLTERVHARHRACAWFDQS